MPGFLLQGLPRFLGGIGPESTGLVLPQLCPGGGLEKHPFLQGSLREHPTTLGDPGGAVGGNLIPLANRCLVPKGTPPGH